MSLSIKKCLYVEVKLNKMDFAKRRHSKEKSQKKCYNPAITVAPPVAAGNMAGSKTLKKISLFARNMAGSKSHHSCRSTEFHHGSIVRCLQLKYLDCNFAWRHLWNKSRSICPRSHHLQNFKSKFFSLKIWKMVFRIFFSSLKQSKTLQRLWHSGRALAS